MATTSGDKRPDPDHVLGTLKSLIKALSEEEKRSRPNGGRRVEIRLILDEIFHVLDAYFGTRMSIQEVVAWIEERKPWLEELGKGK